jgi:hypothetical protein
MQASRVAAVTMTSMPGARRQEALTANAHQAAWSRDCDPRAFGLGKGREPIDHAAVSHRTQCRGCGGPSALEGRKMDIAALLAARWPRFTLDGRLYDPATASPVADAASWREWRWLQGSASAAAPGIALAVLLPVVMIALGVLRYCCGCTRCEACCAWLRCGSAHPTPVTKWWRCGFSEGARSYSRASKHGARLLLLLGLAGLG